MKPLNLELHRNLLFFLTMRNESDEKQQIMEANEPKQTNLDKENDASSEQINNYKGPVTRSKTKKKENILLLKANMLVPTTSMMNNTVYS